ncbi:MAG: UDP-N-acetylmuramoyl-L-alanine--D-glutamate ligase, partial [Leptolyngbyaceae cyanobacterium]
VAWQGGDVVNGSRATGYAAAAGGLREVAAPASLGAGGGAEAGGGVDWLQEIQSKAASVLLIGSAAAQFAQRLDEVDYTTYEIVETLERAVQRSIELAPQLSACAVLLSPACASFDQYPNFEVRGDHFRQLCQATLLVDG